MSTYKLDVLQTSYKQAAENWVNAIRAEEALTTPDNSEGAMQHWDKAEFRVRKAEKQAGKRGTPTKKGWASCILG